MSIEKLDAIKVKKANIPYTQIYSKVLQKITHLEALAVYVYLCSLPPDWVIVKEQVKKHFGIGDTKIKQIFSYLIRAKLLTYDRERNEDGTLKSSTISLLCGDEFDENEPFIKHNEKNINESSTGSIPNPVVSTGSIYHPVVNHTSGSGALQRKYRNTKEIKEKNSVSLFEKPKASETKQTAKFWEPGNPDYDRFHGVVS